MQLENPVRLFLKSLMHWRSIRSFHDQFPATQKIVDHSDPLVFGKSVAELQHPNQPHYNDQRQVAGFAGGRASRTRASWPFAQDRPEITNGIVCVQADHRYLDAPRTVAAFISSLVTACPFLLWRSRPLILSESGSRE
jgi:hypothetical protein